MSDYITENEAKAAVDESKTGNISKQKREDLLKKIEEIRKYISDAPQDENTGNLLSYLSEIEKDVNGKKYGLVFEEHREDIDEVLDAHTPVLTEETDLFIDNGGQMNFLIEGDNLASLKLLEKTHKGKIDLIYIDPPYNTLKSGFTYSDTYIDISDSFRHSKWLSFMKRRLETAKSLMAPKAVIFISIDNSELYDLKMLCDELFGEENFVGNIVWKTTTDNNITQITTEHEYILCYAENKNTLDKWISKSPIIDTIQNKYEELRLKYDENNSSIQKELRKWIKENKEELKGFTHYDNVDDKGVFHDGDIANTVQGGYKYDVIHPVTGKICKIPEKGFRFSEETMKSMLANDNIMFGKDENTLIKPKIRLLDNTSTLRAYYYEDNRVATKNLEKLFKEKSRFSNPKSTNLLKMLFSYATHKNAIILDFFAGSGSTGEAVLQLNHEDGGDRQFILCTNNEISAINSVKYLHSQGYLLDYSPGERIKSSTIWNRINKSFKNDKDSFNELFINNKGKQQHEQYGICKFVTYPRLKTVITGIRNDESRFSDGLKGSLKYYKTEFVRITERMYYEYADELLKHIRELVELENGINFIGNAEIAIVLTDEELNEFTNNVEQYSACKKIYMGHDLLPDEEQERIIRENDIEINIIPDYYYKDLQEK